MDQQTGLASDYDTFEGTCDSIMDNFIEAVGDNDLRSGYAGELASRVDDFQESSTAIFDDNQAVIDASFASHDEAVNAAFDSTYSSAWDRIIRLRADVDARLSP